MIYEQFIVSIVEMIMLSWQPILLYNFHNMRVTWLFYHFFKLQVHILHSLENISIFNIWKLWLVSCDVIFSGTSLILPKMSENFWRKEIPLRWFPDSTLKLNNSRTTWPISAIYISFSSILNALSYEINLFSRCSSPLTWIWTKKQQSCLQFVNKLRVAHACKSESFICPFVCRANQGRDIAPLSVREVFCKFSNNQIICCLITEMELFCVRRLL